MYVTYTYKQIGSIPFQEKYSFQSIHHGNFITDEFNIYTREAGAGELSLAVEGPSKAKLDVVDRGHGYTTVGYTVTKDGKA